MPNVRAGVTVSVVPTKNVKCSTQIQFWKPLFCRKERIQQHGVGIETGRRAESSRAESSHSKGKDVFLSNCLSIEVSELLAGQKINFVVPNHVV